MFRRTEPTVPISVFNAVLDTVNKMLEQQNAVNKALVEELQRSNERLVSELRSLLFPTTNVTMIPYRLSDEEEDAEYMKEHGFIDREQYEEMLKQARDLDNLEFDLPGGDY